MTKTLVCFALFCRMPAPGMIVFTGVIPAVYRAAHRVVFRFESHLLPRVTEHTCEALEYERM